jgi:DNA-binding HxlR family transcriptional regulator
MLILRDLFLGSTKFTELMASSSGSMPARMLSDRLKMLEERGFIERHVYSEHPLRAEYRLTALGESLKPIGEAIFQWGVEHALDERERDAVLRHLYGERPRPGARLRFPKPLRKPGAPRTMAR